MQRHDLRFVEAEIPMPGLPRDLDGLRIVQLSDIHLGLFVSEAVLERAVGMANDARAHVALITGDLISQRGDPLETCLRLLSNVKSDAGMLGCLGNHEIYAANQDYTAEAGSKLGIKFLRHGSRMLQFGNARINFTGVDYQRKSKEYLRNTEQLVVPGVTNVLLSHNPDVFPVAVKKGFDLTLAGHTHGGQVNFEILEQNVNIARFLTPYVYGHYQQGSSSLFVTRGIGTVGVPARLGAPPEVALIRLCAT
ncbi:MAG: metallophosphoesterase, partial [Longimicrobiales bacterium]